MPRIHFFEFEDQPWFPHVLRELMTDYLSFMAKVVNPYPRFTERLHRVLAACKVQKLVDLCSGGGSPAWDITSLLRERHGYPTEVLLTDLYPNLMRLQQVKDRAGGSIDFCPDPVDATQV